MANNIVLGVDGGGTYTRVMAVNLEGQVLAYVESGGANPSHNSNAKENVQSAIAEAIAEAGSEAGDVVYSTSGFAGLDSIEDQAWANDFTALNHLSCPRLQVNDAVIAHAGALRSRPGIIVILGTGSILFAVTEQGRYIRNYDFRHYAASAARHLAYEAVYRIIAGEFQTEDEAFVNEVLAYWGVPHIAALCERGMDGFVSNIQDSNRQFANMGPTVTAAAAHGVPLARSVCDAGVKAVETGVRLLGQCFSGEEVLVSMIGGVARSNYMSRTFHETLSRNQNKKYTIVKPSFSAVAGAVLMGFERLGIEVEGPIARMLAEHPKATYED